MRAYWTLVRRELGVFFNSFTGYAVVAAVLLLLGASLWDMLMKLNATPTTAPMTEIFFSTVYFWLILLLIPPVITMRVFAAERSSGTYETLMTAPVSDLQVVLAKFTGALMSYLLTWLPLLVCLLFLSRLSDNQLVVDTRIAASTYLGILLIGMLYMSMGCFASALTKSQVLAAITAFVLGMGIFLLGLRSLVAMPAEGVRAELFGYIAMYEHMEWFARGVVDTRPLTYYLSGTVFFLYLTLKVVESRRWK